jgi:hypothetical protein
MAAQSLSYYGYVERPYDEVRERLHQAPLELFQRATSSGARRATDMFSQLRIGDGVQLGIATSIQIDQMRDDLPVEGGPPLTGTSVDLTWKASTMPALFPLMHATLSAWPVTESETQIVIDGHYDPPFGLVGTAIDRAVGHRVAQASVHRFLEDLLDELRRAVPPRV